MIHSLIFAILLLPHMIWVESQAAEPDRIEDLILQLESPRLSERNVARDRLMLMGRNATPALRTALGQNPSFALKHAVEYILLYAPPKAEFLKVRGGEVSLGTRDLIDDNPIRRRTLNDFEMGAYEVTCLEYRVFAKAEKVPDPLSWIDGEFRFGDEALPVTGITFDEAKRCAEFFGARLPSIDEWERAARGDEGFVYPWGNTSRNGDAVASSNRPVRVGLRVADVSPYGVVHMAGNVSEWVLNNQTQPPGPAVLGGAFNSNDPRDLRVSRRAFGIPGKDRHAARGFRMARDSR